MARVPRNGPRSRAPRRCCGSTRQARVGGGGRDAERAAVPSRLVERLLADAEDRQVDLGPQLLEPRVAEGRDDDRCDPVVLGGLDADLDDAGERILQVLRRGQERRDPFVALALHLGDALRCRRRDLRHRSRGVGVRIRIDQDDDLVAGRGCRLLGARGGRHQGAQDAPGQEHGPDGGSASGAKPRSGVGSRSYQSSSVSFGWVTWPNSDFRTFGKFLDLPRRFRLAREALPPHGMLLAGGSAAGDGALHPAAGDAVDLHHGVVQLLVGAGSFCSRRSR